MATTTLADLKATADAANAKVADAEHRLETARADLLQASSDHHRAIVALTEQPAATAPSGKSAKVALAVTVSPLESAEQRLEKALADYEQVRRDLGLS